MGEVPLLTVLKTGGASPEHLFCRLDSPIIFLSLH